MKPHSVFLRKECILPERLDPLTEPVGENWTLVEEITAPVLDTMIRRMGWHFLCVLRPYYRRGFGVTEADAVRRALARALRGVARQYNAAELVSVRATKHLGLHIANVTLQPRLIQQHTWLDFPDKRHPQAVPAS
ncbi:MAG: hypothetical protein ABSF23_11065 [Terracidiphilus sp.]